MDFHYHNYNYAEINEWYYFHSFQSCRSFFIFSSWLFAFRVWAFSGSWKGMYLVHLRWVNLESKGCWSQRSYYCLAYLFNWTLEQKASFLYIFIICWMIINFVACLLALLCLLVCSCYCFVVNYLDKYTNYNCKLYKVKIQKSIWIKQCFQCNVINHWISMIWWKECAFRLFALKLFYDVSLHDEWRVEDLWKFIKKVYSFNKVS